MNNIVQSELLTSYIKNPGVQKMQSTAVFAQQKIDNENKNDTFVSSKKKKIAKAMLLSTTALFLCANVAMAFRHKGGFVKHVKNIYQQLKNNGKSAARGFQGATKGLQDAAASNKYGDNITNGKDALTRHFGLKLPLYKYFDNFTTNTYRKAMHSTCARNAKKASTAFKDADNVITEVIKKSGADNSDAIRLSELLSKKRKAVIEFTKPENVRIRINDLDSSLERLDFEAWENIKKFNKNNFKDKLKYYSKSSLVENGFKDAKISYENAILKFKNGGLTDAECEEFETLLKKLCKDNNTPLVMMKRANKLFDNAFNKENVDLIQKMRDINCGSAPTDIISIIMTMGLFGIYAAQADTKEERISVSLTSGVPLVMALGTTITATCNMISGAKALGLSLLTGFIANKIGGAVDKKYQSINNKEAPKTIVTIDDYLQTIKDATGISK